MTLFLFSTNVACGIVLPFGSGPGVGRNVGAVFAEHGFEKVILLSRDANRLAEDAEFVKSAHPASTVDVVPGDLSDHESVKKSLAKIDELLKGTPLEAVLYNAARLGKSPFFEFTPEDLENDLRVRHTSYKVILQGQKHLILTLLP